MKSTIKSIKGTRDFYPEDMAIRTWLYRTLRKVSESFGYQEYEGPFLESIQLYAAKSGEELVKEQSFVFPDRGGDLVTLRPELTPTLVRMIAQRQRQLVFPLRWWSFGPFWRYERPQKGRSREFFQWNVDLVGVDSPEADAELVAVIAAFFQQVGLTPKEVKILINNRRLLDAELTNLEVPPEQHPAVSRWIDRRDKMSGPEWDSNAKDIGLSNFQLSGMKSLLENEDLWEKSEELRRFFAALDSLGTREYAEFDLSIVRGLDYYTGTVFEAKASGGIRRSILGGGRYDDLMAAVGGDQLPGVGFAMGDIVISLVLEQHGCLPRGMGRSPASVLVTVFDSTTIYDSLSYTAELRQSGINVACYPQAVKLGKQFKFADRIGVKISVVLGPDEQRKDQVTIKNMITGIQQTVPRQKGANLILHMLDQAPSS